MTNPDIKKSRLTLLGLMALFILPVASAHFYFDYTQKHGVKSTINKGELISPPKEIPQGFSFENLTDKTSNSLEAWQGRWVLYVVPNDCENKDCTTQATLVRNFRLAMSKDYFRLIPVFQLPAGGEVAAEVVDAINEDINLVKLNEDQQLPPLFQSAGSYLVDPHGRVMMFYEGEFDPKSIKKDLKRLLKINQVG